MLVVVAVALEVVLLAHMVEATLPMAVAAATVLLRLLARLVTQV
jgi:hypothetical protein